MEKNKYLITYIDDKGELTTYDTFETEEELKKRISCYKRNNFKIKKVVKEVVQTTWVEIAY
jgi:hypothetical protein